MPASSSSGRPEQHSKAARGANLSDELAQTANVRKLIEDLLDDPRQLGPDYQPIRRVEDDQVVAFKATGRGRPGTELADTLGLLQGAQSIGLVERLDWTFRCLAFDDASMFSNLELHLTPERETFGTLCPPRLTSSWNRARRNLAIAGEIHLDAFEDVPALRRGVAEIRGWGWRVVVADLGEDTDAWRVAESLHPDVVQIDLAAAGRGAVGGAEMVARRCADWGAELMAVNVNTSAARLAATAAGALTARGDLLGRPDELTAAIVAAGVSAARLES